VSHGPTIKRPGTIANFAEENRLSPRRRFGDSLREGSYVLTASALG
jgi:hypothetical protein